VKQCSAVKPNGERCSIFVKGSKELCWAHDPANREKRRIATSKAGRSKPNTEIRDLKAKLEKLAEDVLEGKLATGRAAVANQLLNTLLRAIETERKIREQEEIVQRLEALERRQDFGSRRGGRNWQPR